MADQQRAPVATFTHCHSTLKTVNPVEEIQQQHIMIASLPAETPDLESSTDAYARRFAGAVGEYFLNVQSQIVKRLLPPPENCSILDVGGGHGQLAGPLVDAGYDVTVFASNDSCRDRLDRVVGKNRYRLLTGDLLNLPCRQNAYDVVLAFRLLPHLNDWNRLLSEACRVATQAVIVDYPDLRSVNILSSFTFSMKQGIEQNARRYRCFRRGQILSELRKHDFQVIATRPQFFLPMALHRYLKRVRVSQTTEFIANRIGLTHAFGSPIILQAIPASP